MNVIGDAGLRQLALKAVERRHQADQPQLGRMQPVRQIVHALGDCSARDSAPRRPAAASAPDAVLPSSSRSIFEQRHLLADVVVQLARNPRALGFLRVQQPRAEVADPLVAVRSSAWLPTHLRLGLSPSRPLNEQPGDQRRLRDTIAQRAPRMYARSDPRPTAPGT